jgi:F-type H+-transporting ATPase subunit epsilon
MPLKLDIVTAEKLVYSDKVDMVIVPGIVGELGILPSHAPLMTMLQPGELRIKKGTEETDMAVSGGFLEVRPDHVIILADTAERAEDIDIARAEAAKKRAQDSLIACKLGMERTQAEAALCRSLARLETVQRRKRRHGSL